MEVWRSFALFKTRNDSGYQCNNKYALCHDDKLPKVNANAHLTVSTVFQILLLKKQRVRCVS